MTRSHLDIYMNIKNTSLIFGSDDELIKTLFERITGGIILHDKFPLIGLWKEPSNAQKVWWYLDRDYSPKHIANILRISQASVSYHKKNDLSIAYHNPTIHLSLHPDYKLQRWYFQNYIDPNSKHISRSHYYNLIEKMED